MKLQLLYAVVLITPCPLPHAPHGGPHPPDVGSGFKGQRVGAAGVREKPGAGFPSRLCPCQSHEACQSSDSCLKRCKTGYTGKKTKDTEILI